jgi:rhodanese-related sulfurtransferase
MSTDSYSESTIKRRLVMRFFPLTFLVGIAILLGACSPQSIVTNSVEADANEQIAAYQTVSMNELADIMAKEEREFTVVNVHIPYQGEIDGTDYNIAYNDLNALTEALPDKDAPIVVYCRSGNMSEQATRDLIELGYTQVFDVPGGMNSWQASGRTLVENQ